MGLSNVFHHITFPEHQEWMNALHNIVTNVGCIFIFEHNPYNPVTNHIFKTSEIDRGATMLKPAYCYKLLQNANFTHIERNYALFFLWRNKLLTTIERGLYWLPLGAQYYVYARKEK